MKTPSLFLLLGVSIPLLSALVICTVVSFWPPHSSTRLLIQLVVMTPYFISTFRMVSVLGKMKPGLSKANSKEMICRTPRRPVVGGDQEFEEDYDDVDAEVIEYDF